MIIHLSDHLERYFHDQVQGPMVNRFQKPGTELFVNGDRPFDDLCRKRLKVIPHASAFRRFGFRDQTGRRPGCVDTFPSRCLFTRWASSDGCLQKTATGFTRQSETGRSLDQWFSRSVRPLL
jgi:hypothetical protein